MRPFRRPSLALAVPCLAPALLALAACTAPVGESTEEGSQALLTPAPIHGPQPNGTPSPTLFTAGPNETIQLASATADVCLLQGVSGDLSSAASYARVLESGSAYYLETGAGTFARASCIAWSAFYGSGATGPESTLASPYVLNVQNPLIKAGGTTFTAAMWGSNAACFLSGIAGDWQDAAWGNQKTPLLETYVGEGNILDIDATGPDATTYADCYAFAGRSSVVTQLNYAEAPYARSAALPSSTTSICGLIEIKGFFGSSVDEVEIVPGASGAQTLVVVGNVGAAGASCINFQQLG